MKKLTWIIGFTLLSVILVTGCTEAATPNDSETQPPVENSETQTPNENTETSENEQASQEAIKAAETYKTKEYTINEVPETSEEIFVERNKEMEPFFAENHEEKPGNASNIALALRVAITQQASLKPENMEFTVYQELENYFDLDYKMDLVSEKQNGENERIPLKGRLTLVSKDGKWLVQADDFDKPAFAELLQEEK
ncbi:MULTISPECIES: hypothetical protein [Paenibacillus]|uniref:hypothetical protein n=1 Tax=Paenibacillus TaxID=44249 RepID=UPI000B80D54A|nr:hypothetical protein [Paenibacillus amylolyticus]